MESTNRFHPARRLPSTKRERVDIMENLNNTHAIESLRTNVADALGTAYGAQKEYALALNTMFSFDWFEVNHYDKSETAKPVHAEKKALFEELKRVNHSNPSTIWARIRDYGRTARYGETETTEGETETAEGEGGNARHNKSPIVRNIDDLLALYKFNSRQSDLDPKVKDAQLHIVKALETLGVDLSKVETK